MPISVFQLFSIGIGPSSSHTVGPMRAARTFLTVAPLASATKVKAELYGSLALTGEGHGTEKAILLGFAGETPEGVDPAAIDSLVAAFKKEGKVPLLGGRSVPFEIVYHMDKTFPEHPNGMRFTLNGFQKVYFSIGGGFIVESTELGKLDGEEPYPFNTASELLDICKRDNLSIAEVMRREERKHRTDEEIDAGLRKIWEAMKACTARGLITEGTLPGGLGVKRRAPAIYQTLLNGPPDVMDWLSVWALAVNEENAAGGRVVTAPTNGASGIIPSVLHYYFKFVPDANEKGMFDFLLTAAAICILYKKGASISAAEMGCQGEVGVACSIAAAGLAAVWGGSPAQVENAAEIGIEHNLGLTCDPVKGLVQIPCIERNTMGAIKAVNAARLALKGEGEHHVKLDQAIRTMKQVGDNMSSIFKETSQGGLAVNVIFC